jgi:hypothetical protein
VEKLLGLEIGKRYTFVGYKSTEAYAEVLRKDRFDKYFIAKLHRPGHPFDGDHFPFDAMGKYIGCLRWQQPDLEFVLEDEQELPL